LATSGGLVRSWTQAQVQDTKERLQPRDGFSIPGLSTGPDPFQPFLRGDADVGVAERERMFLAFLPSSSLCSTWSLQISASVGGARRSSTTGNQVGAGDESPDAGGSLRRPSHRLSDTHPPSVVFSFLKIYEINQKCSKITSFASGA
jgi:hypothetical protein